MKTVVVLQPQFFPWLGVFEQLRLADEFVHLDDAQFQKGGFTNRVQIKTANGPAWLTVPVLRYGSLPPIHEVEIDYVSDWRAKHRKTLQMTYARAPHVARMLALVDAVYDARPATIAELDIVAVERCAAELGLRPTFTRSSQTPLQTSKTDRLIELLVPRGATAYVTGLGALNYLDEPALAAAGVDVRVMQYERAPYPQLFGPFDPHVSVLDALANLGSDAATRLRSPAIPWNAYRRSHAPAAV